MNSTEQQQMLSQNIKMLTGRRVLIIGDIGLDEYVVGSVKRISPEAPVPVVDVYEQFVKLGLAANVAANVRALGSEPVLLAAIGDDQGGEQMRHLLESNQISASHLVVLKDRPTTRKMRVMADHHHVVRVDFEKKIFVQEAAVQGLLQKAIDLIAQVDIVIVQDYGKGLIHKQVMEGVSKLAKSAGKKVIVDPHRHTPVSDYVGADLLKPNLDEAYALAGLQQEGFAEHRAGLDDLGQALRLASGCTQLVITQGKQGMMVFDQNLPPAHVPTFARQVFDVTGAGDTVISVLGLALAAGLSLKEGALLANFAAGFVVSKVGCVPCSTDDLRGYVESHLLKS